MITDISHHFQEIVVRLLNLTAKTFHDADDFISEFDRKANAGVQSLLGCHRRSRKSAVTGDVSNPLWFAAAPNSSRQTHTARKLALAGECLERGYVDGRKTPKVYAGQLVGRPVHVPDRTQLPLCRFTHSLDNFGRGIRHARRFSENSTHRILDTESLLEPSTLQNNRSHDQRGHGNGGQEHLQQSKRLSRVGSSGRAKAVTL